ncbi:hypothetical protein QBC44DRAFT_393607 [Cladorrhinum sp. PSN332]|nr:hypothetical protein QBC44DRAFT_393607 [Cladorrhinum sp. PSN332]
MKPPDAQITYIIKFMMDSEVYRPSNCSITSANGSMNSVSNSAITCTLIRPRSADPFLSNSHTAGSGPSQLKLALLHKAYWTPGYEIHVRFLPNSKNSKLSEDRYNHAKEGIKEITREGTDAANIYFSFDNAAEAPVRVRLYSGVGGVSTLGTLCRELTAADEPTIEIGVSDNMEDFRFSVLHEFGHVLGAVHEHSSPKTDITWDEKKVKAKYLESHEWDAGQVEDQGIIKIYPRFSIDKRKGVYYSWDYKGWKRLDPRNIAFVKFDAPVPQKAKPPVIAVGIAQADLICRKNLRLKAASDGVRKDGFTARTETWEKDSELASAGVMWLKISARAPMERFTERRVNFKTDSFKEAPEVVVWTKGFHIGRGESDKWNGEDWSLHISAGDITKDGFRLHIKREENSVLYRAIVTWVAYPRGKPGFFSGIASGSGNAIYAWPDRDDNKIGFLNRVSLEKQKQVQD